MKKCDLYPVSVIGNGSPSSARISKCAIDSGSVVDLSKDEYHELELTKIFQKEKGGE